MVFNMLSEKDKHAKGPFPKQRTPGEEKETSRILAEFTKNTKWFFDNEEELRAKYGDMFIVVYDCAVVMSDKNPDRLASRVWAKYGRNSTAFVEFLPKEEITMVV